MYRTLYINLIAYAIGFIISSKHSKEVENKFSSDPNNIYIKMEKKVNPERLLQINLVNTSNCNASMEVFTNLIEKQQINFTVYLNNGNGNRVLENNYVKLDIRRYCEQNLTEFLNCIDLNNITEIYKSQPISIILTYFPDGSYFTTFQIPTSGWVSISPIVYLPGGLNVTYFSGRGYTGLKTLGLSPLSAFSCNVSCSAYFTGYVIVPYTEVYDIYFHIDDEIDVYLNGVRFKYCLWGCGDDPTSILLYKGTMNLIQIFFNNISGGGYFNMSISSPSLGPKRQFPPNILYSGYFINNIILKPYYIHRSTFYQNSISSINSNFTVQACKSSSFIIQSKDIFSNNTNSSLDSYSISLINNKIISFHVNYEKNGIYNVSFIASVTGKNYILNVFGQDGSHISKSPYKINISDGDLDMNKFTIVNLSDTKIAGIDKIFTIQLYDLCGNALTSIPLLMPNTSILLQLTTINYTNEFSTSVVDFNQISSKIYKFPGILNSNGTLSYKITQNIAGVYNLTINYGNNNYKKLFRVTAGSIYPPNCIFQNNISTIYVNSKYQLILMFRDFYNNNLNQAEKYFVDISEFSNNDTIITPNISPFPGKSGSILFTLIPSNPGYYISKIKINGLDVPSFNLTVIDYPPCNISYQLRLKNSSDCIYCDSLNKSYFNGSCVSSGDLCNVSLVKSNPNVYESCEKLNKISYNCNCVDECPSTKPHYYNKTSSCVSLFADNLFIFNNTIVNKCPANYSYYEDHVCQINNNSNFSLDLININFPNNNSKNQTPVLVDKITLNNTIMGLQSFPTNASTQVLDQIKEFASILDINM